MVVDTFQDGLGQLVPVMNGDLDLCEDRDEAMGLFLDQVFQRKLIICLTHRFLEG